ncbi:MAG: DEAD/DEAH box helicase family protein [Patescibacteria group bacterium]
MNKSEPREHEVDYTEVFTDSLINPEVAPELDQVQEDCLREIAYARDQGEQRALVVLASGMGKTRIAAKDVSNFFIENPNSRVLYLCHQNEILRQAEQEFRGVLGSPHSYGQFAGHEKEFDEVNCLFASFQTMRDWKDAFLPEEFDYIIVDEGHHSAAKTYQPVLEYFNPRFALGLTATPDRGDLKDIRAIFGPERYSMPLEEALAEGHLARIDYRLMADEIDWDEVRKAAEGHVTMADLNRRVFIEHRDEEIVGVIDKHRAELDGAKVMVFCPSIAYCDRLAEVMPDAVTIHSALSAGEQRLKLEDFRSGLINTVVTVDKFNEGIDIPDANLVVFLRSTASKNIFIQQLGRGLRKTPEKQGVRILDFVNNLERMELIDELWRDVTERYRRMHGTAEQEALVVDIGTVSFEEINKDLQEVLELLRQGYTKEKLVGQLLALAEELGKSPSIPDIRRAQEEKRCASPGTFARHFGSYNKALEAAGLESRAKPPSYTTEELVQQLTNLANELGVTPLVSDIDSAHEEGICASTDVFRSRFGSLRQAREAAELEATEWRRYSDHELLEQLTQLTEELGHAPTSSDINRAFDEGRTASIDTFHRRFGTLAEAHKIARVFDKRTHRLSDQQLLSQLKQLHEVEGRPLNRVDLAEARREGRGPSPQLLVKRFGSTPEALRRAGIPLRIPAHRKFGTTEFTEEDLIQRLVAYSEELGRVPSQSELVDASKQGKCPNASVFARHFGTYNKAVKAAGLKPVAEKPSYTDDELLEQLRSLAKELGSIPTKNQVKELSKRGKCATSTTFIKRFGTFEEALQLADIHLKDS